MRIQHIGLLLLLAQGLAASENENEKEEPRSHIRGGGGTIDHNNNNNNKEPLSYEKPKGYSALNVVGKVTESGLEDHHEHAGKHTKEFEDAHYRNNNENDADSEADDATTPVRTHTDLSMGHHRAGLLAAKKQAAESNRNNNENASSNHNNNDKDDDDSSRRRRTKQGNRRLVDEGGKEHVECLPPNQQFIVTCKDDTVELECLDELEDAGVEIVHMIHDTKFFAVCVEHKADWAALMALADVNDVEEDPVRTFSDYLVEDENSMIPSGNEKDEERHLQQRVPYGVELVGAIEFWGRYNKQGESVKVCVVDTGLDNSHEDLDTSRTDGSNDGDLVRPWFQDGNGHGTHVAGTVAAEDNGRGVVGVAPKVDLFIARVFDNDGRFTASSLIDAMNECAIGGSDIISMSLGGPTASRAEQDAVESLRDRGILLVAAAGNSGNQGNPLEFPSGYSAVMSVGAVDESSEIALFSSHNAEVDIAGPGVAVESLETGGGTSLKSGTSMATPHVSAVAALLMSQFPNEPTSRIRQAMEITATDLGPCGPDKLFGHGLVNAMAAANYLETGSTGGSGSASAGCIQATVNTRTDNFGEESMWFIIRKPSANSNPQNGEVVFRGGPYQNELIADYQDTFFLPSDGCYEFLMTDAFGDGTCCDFGNGRHEFIFNGETLLFEDQYEEGTLSVTFNCGNDGGGSNGGGNSAVCGNGIREAGEQCDEGSNNSNTGTCTLNCRNARCGDGFLQPGEQCDEGSNNNNRGTCTASCQRARCGDGFVQPGEQCDRGNSNSNTGTCTATCQNARCGDGFVQPGEQCDRGNANSNTGTCTASCQNARCGDGFVQPGEQCDDGNTRNGDGCSSTCQVENSTGGGGDSTSSCSSGLVAATLNLVTDNWSYFQNELYFFDVATSDDDFIWYASRFDLGNNLRYEAEVCLDPSGCYEFYFFDSWGNGLTGQGELTLTWGGQTALTISPGDQGSPWPNSSRMIYWGVGLGNCS